jgi:hypothetical protein
MPSGLTANTTYYAQAESAHTFKVRATPSGAALTFSDADDPILVVTALDRDSCIAWAGAVLEDMLPAHVMPLEDPIPPIIRMTCAELAAGKLLSTAGGASASLVDIVDKATKRLERWAKGVPLRASADAPAPPAAGLAASATAPFADRRGWSRFGGL